MRRILRGVGAVGGVGVGPALVVGPEPLVARRAVTDVKVELARLREAVSSVRHELESLRSADDANEVVSLILDTHLLLLRDELLFDAALRCVETEQVDAAFGLHQTSEELVARLGAVDSPYLRERCHDVRQVTRLVLDRLGPHRGVADAELVQGAVVIAHDLSPADAMRLARSEAAALVTETGSSSGHTALVARTYGMVALVGVADATHVVASGETTVVDAVHNRLVVHPTESDIARAEERRNRHASFAAKLRRGSEASGSTDVCTPDGAVVRVQANLELSEEVALAVEAGADGVGLYRTEFVLLGSCAVSDEEVLASEEEQLAAYTRVVQALSPRPVTIRTYDLGGDKLPGSRLNRSAKAASRSSALGLRAIRFSLSAPDLFRIQLRAVCRAAAHGPVRLMFPLVTTANELREAIRLLRAVEQELDVEHIERGDVEVGAMIEVPAAALNIRHLLREVSFVSVGTNDLVQYTLAVDRANAAVAHLADPLDPAHLKLLAQVAQACRAAGVDHAMCGNMAADLVCLPVVLGLGFRCLSVPCAAVPLTKAAIRCIDTALADEVVRAALEVESARDVRALVKEHFEKDAGDLWRRSGSSNDPSSSTPPPM